ncbi:MAG: hypothetical protein KA120_05695, partial [Candidatus Goldbacteria bacterium]|nr:hypothetical protein [Candidatus Goldiibacteriota bacterium]
DWYHTSDTWLCSSNYGYGTDCNQPGGLIRRFHQESLNAGMQSIITVPMAGYVAADQAGTVTLAQTAPSSRWKQVVPKKSSSLVYPPDLTDNYVYVDEEVNYLVSVFGNASTETGVKFYDLDNEPALWDDTHPRIHPTPCGASEIVTRSIATAKAIKDVDPYCEILAPVFFGFWAMNDFGNPPDWTTEKGSYQWFVDYYLAKMKQASDTDGRRLLDAIDFHWYSEAREGTAPPFTYNTPGVCRITEDSCTSSAAQIARMQAPRTLWDTTYVENSPIAQWYPWALPLIPKLQNSINTYYPGTKITITEFAHGGGNDYSGGISMADTLGIFGKYGVYAATMWKTAYGPYHSAAYKIFRNYNGANGKYGDTKVYCESNDIPNMTTYASINGSDEKELHIIVINKAGTNQTANVNITSGMTYTSVECWGFGGANYNITSRAAPVLTGNTFSYSVPAHFVLHFVLKSNATPTRTPVNTMTRTATRTITPSLTLTPGITLTWTRTISPTYSVSPTITQTWTGTPPSPTITQTITQSWTISQTSTYTDTGTRTPTLTASSTFNVPSSTFTATNTATWTRTAAGTPTQTRTVTATWIITVTRTATGSQQPTTSFTETGNQQTTINDVFIYPNPVVKNTQKVFLYCDVSGQIDSIKLKIYTMGFREIEEVKFSGNLFTTLEIPRDKINKLACGIYYYVCVVKDKKGNEQKSKITHFIIIK